VSKLTEADIDAASSWLRYPATPYNTGRVAIGKRYKPAARAQDTTYTEDQVQAALLAWRDTSANDSRILGSSRDLHRVRVGKRNLWWRLMRVVRELWSSKAPRVWR
jgi:hypothetical protein